jgi:hypothetical protein
MRQPDGPKNGGLPLAIRTEESATETQGKRNPVTSHASPTTALTPLKKGNRHDL